MKSKAKSANYFTNLGKFFVYTIKIKLDQIKLSRLEKKSNLLKAKFIMIEDSEHLSEKYIKKQNTDIIIDFMKSEKIFCQFLQ